MPGVRHETRRLEVPRFVPVAPGLVPTLQAGVGIRADGRMRSVMVGDRPRPPKAGATDGRMVFGIQRFCCTPTPTMRVGVTDCFGAPAPKPGRSARCVTVSRSVPEFVLRSLFVVMEFVT